MNLRHQTIVAAVAAALFGSVAFAQDATGDFTGVSVLAVPDGSITLDQPVANHSGVNMTLLTAGYQVANTPCFNCVHGTTPDTMGISFPFYELVHGSAVRFTVALHSTTGAATCSVKAAFKVGSKTLTGTYTFPSGCAANTIYAVEFSTTLGTTTGYATLTATLTDPTGSYPTVLNLKVN